MHHGGDLTVAIARYDIPRQDWLDLSTGINPRAYPVPELDDDVWRRLPSQADLQAMLTAARIAYDVPLTMRIAAAPGAQAIIESLPALAPEGDVAVIGPTYGPHTASWRRAGRTVSVIAGLDALPSNARVAVLANPNNPDGRVTGRDEMISAARTLAVRGGLLVVDEAFVDLAPELSIVPDLTPDLPILVIRSFGKFYGLSGVRLGFAVASAERVSRLAARLGDWAVSGPALIIGAKALGDQAWQAATRSWIVTAATALETALFRAGLAVTGQAGLFCLAMKVDAAGLHDALARQGIWCRKFDFSPTWLRFGLPGSNDELERLEDALERIHPDR